MEAIIHTVLNASIVASVTQYDPNVNNDEIPEPIFNRTLSTITIGEIFRKVNDEYINIETTSDREHTI